MIPLRDSVPARRAPVVTWVLIALNIGVFLGELSLGPAEAERLFYLFGLVPPRFTHPDWAYWVGFPVESWWPLLLAADEILMSPHAVLGPVDPQLGGHAGASILRAVERKPIAKVKDETLILADVAEKAIQQVREAARQLLSRSQAPEKAEALAGLLATGTWTHDHPITSDEAAAMGLPVKTEMPREVLQLMALFPQPVRRQRTVEYVPEPRRNVGGDRRERA